MYRFLLLLFLLQPLAAQTATQVCSDGRVLPLTPFNRNPCGSTPAPDPDPSSGETTPTPEPDSTPAPDPQTTSSPTITCEDGRVVHRTPFNPAPCQVAPPAAETEVPDEFLALFGETPAAVGLEIEDRLSEQTYKSRYEGFVAAIDEPEGFAAVAGRYAAAGLGEAGFYQDRTGPRVRWSEAPFHPAEAGVDEALGRPDAVIGTWQTQAILRGGVASDALASVPATARALNNERLGETGGEVTGTPTVLTWSASSRAALAAHASGPELVGPADGRELLTAPARPGDFVVLLATGLGGAATVELRLGGVPIPRSDFAFARVADNRGGVWRLVARVPGDAPAGELSVAVTADGVSSHAGPYLTVSR